MQVSRNAVINGTDTAVQWKTFYSHDYHLGKYCVKYRVFLWNADMKLFRRIRVVKYHESL